MLPSSHSSPNWSCPSPHILYTHCRVVGFTEYEVDMHERHAVELEQVKQLLREVLQGTQVPFTSYSVLGQLKQTPEVIG